MQLVHRLRLAFPAVALASAVASVSAQGMPFARQSAAGPLEIWLVAETTGAAHVVFSDVAFLPIALAGSAHKDRLRLDRPTVQGADGPAAHVRLPGGGSLYRVAWEASTAILHVRADGQPQIILSVPDGGSGPALLERLFVTPDGAAALAATSLGAGGDVLRLDLAVGSAASLTTELPPLAVDDVSLRLSAQAGWFVAGGALFRTSAGPLTQAAPVDTSGFGPSVFGELALADEGAAVAAVLGSTAGDRSIVVVGSSGPPMLATDAPGSYDTPGYGHPLGPFLALSPDGGRLAFRCLIDDAQELFVKDVPLPQPAQLLTAAPDFPVYIDNVGVLGFGASHALCFFGGDSQISNVSAEEMLGAADMYLADFSTPGTVQYSNLTQTNGQAAPPFSDAATLTFSQAVLDPQAQRFLLLGEEDAGGQMLSAFALPGTWTPAGVSTLLVGASEPPELRALHGYVLVELPVDEEEQGDSAGVQQVLLLPPLSAGATQLVTLAALPGGITLDRWTADHAGQYAACVASASPALQIPVHLLLSEGLLLLTWFQPFGVSPALGFSSSDTLHLGLGAAGGPYKFAAFTAPLAGQGVALPVGNGFPLAH